MAAPGLSRPRKWVEHSKELLVLTKDVRFRSEFSGSGQNVANNCRTMEKIYR